MPHRLLTIPVNAGEKSHKTVFYESISFCLHPYGDGFIKHGLILPLLLLAAQNFDLLERITPVNDGRHVL